MAENKGIVKVVLKNLYGYLKGNLPVDQELAGKLYGWDPPLIQGGQHQGIRASISRGRSDEAFQEWYDFASANYTEDDDSLNNFIKCLKTTGKDARPMLIQIAGRIEKEIKRVKKSSSGESESDDTKPSSSSNSSRDTVSQEDSMVSRERSQKKDSPSVEPPPKQARKEVPEKLLGHRNGGNLVEENKWDQLKSAICSIRREDKSTGFVVKLDGCLYLLTTLHSFLTGEQEKMTNKDRRSQIKEAATQAKYRFFYTEQWANERATEEEIEGKDIVKQSNAASIKFDQELDIVAVPLVEDFESKRPKITPISLDELDKLKDKSWCDYYTTIIGHPYGMPLSRSIAAITDMKGESFGYDGDTGGGSSGSPVVVATDQNNLLVVGVHRGGGGPDSKLNYAALLLPFVQGQL